MSDMTTQEALQAFGLDDNDLGTRLLEVHTGESSAEDFIVSKASAGLFNDGRPQRHPRTSEPCRFSLHELTQRDYVVRYATESDLDRLVQLEDLCWHHTQTPRTQILARIQKYSRGQFVLEKDGKVLGVIYSQRIVDAEALLGRSAADVHELHDESGSIIQLLAVNLDPQVQNAGYGDQLLEFMLQRCSLTTGIDRVVGVTLCKSFDGSRSFEEYIRLEGSSQDPVLAFHYAHGAEIVKTVPGYRPEDFANLHHGVLVAYDIHNRPERRQIAGADAIAKTFDRQQISQFVRAEAAQILNINESEIDIERPVMEMGLDSADLLKLQRLCEEHFGLKLQAGFFFQYSSIAKVIDYLASKLAPAQEIVKAAEPVLEQRMDADRVSATDVAIIGMACKLPGGIETPADLWRVLSTGDCVIGSFPTSRRNWPSSNEFPGIDQGGFVSDADAFDAAFFRISPAEAQITDPQQRMLMQLAWATLEDAGILPAALKGSNTGVFVGASNCDYSRLMQEAGVAIEPHHGVGSSLAILANRISYFFDLSGPSLVVDTACSSSLVALHAAVQSLRSGECATAIAGGVNLITHPHLSIAYHKAGMLSPDGRCKTFDASADGYVRSEGSVVLLLKPLRAAIEDGNRVHAVIRGSATNHGGLAGGLTVPNPQKQKELLVAAWKDAGIAPRELTYLEAHGTGTSLGDPIEVQGMQAAYAELDPAVPAASCAIGSIKSNLGHLESAAGVTGLLKVVLAFQQQQLPASVNYKELNPKIRLSDTPFVIQDQLRDWSAQQPRVAGVSSFGSGGANAHVVVQEFINGDANRADESSLFVLSAANEERLRAYASLVVEWLDREATDKNFANAIFTWQTGRTAMKQRLAIKVSDRIDLRNKLQQWLAGNPVADLWQKDSSVAQMWQTKSGRQMLQHALSSRDVDALGPAWAAGIDVDWRESYEHAPIPVSVPTYPFAKDRYWIESRAVAGKTIVAASAIHPLLHTNTSNLSQQSYSATFTGEEFFLADHQVRADGRNVQKVLPGVAYLEMTRTAIEHALPSSPEPTSPESTSLELLNTVWVQPIVVSDETQVRIALSANDNDQIDFEIYSDDVVHCQGSAVVSHVAEAVKLDLDELNGRMRNGRVESNRLYPAFAQMGLVYGPAFQAITAIEQGDDELFAQLRLPRSIENTAGDYVLHPSLLDGAVQAGVWLIDGASNSQARLPFVLESLRIAAPCTAEMVAWVRYAPGSQAGDKIVKLDIDLCDESGNVCVRMHGFSSRVPGNVTGNLLATPVWQNVELSSNELEYTQHQILDSRQTAQSYSDNALSCFEQVQAILQSKPRGKVLVQIVVADEQFIGLSGLLKTAALENPQFVGQLIVVPPGTDADSILESEKRYGLDAIVRYEHGTRQVLRWQEVTTDTAPVAFKDDGVYLITGGFGGLGTLFTDEILEQTRNARVILTGRGEREVNRDRVAYRRLDLADLGQVQQLVDGIVEEFGRLDGVLHVAGMIADNFLLKKQAAEFAEVLAPKVSGTVNLDEATRNIALDFFVLFSSIAGALGNVGQADYATANGFLDQFAAQRNRLVAAGQRHGRTRSINWPLWQSGGMSMDAVSRELLQRTTGLQPMPAETGLRAFHRSLALTTDQVLVLEGDVAQLRRNVLSAPAVTSQVEVVATEIEQDTLVAKTEEYLRNQLAGVLKLAPSAIDPRAALEEYGIDSMLAMKLTNQLEQSFGSLSKTLFFEYRSIRELAQYFIAQYASQLNALFGVTATRVTVPVPVQSAPIAPRRFGRSRNEAAEAEADPIAIVGLSGRYPGAVDLEAYWNNLRDGKDSIVEVPKDRWDWQAHFSADRETNGRHYSKWGGFIEGVDEFDPMFFNIAPKEAKYIDPQERLFLQHAWMAMEDAGYTRASLQIPHENDLAGQVGVYVGVMWSEYQLFGTAANAEDVRMGFAGNLASIANRVSYVLNLHGPSVTLDTMCSSSMTAIHFACQDLKLGRTSMAIAGGVNVSVHPHKYLLLSVGQFISSDGACQSFGEGGDGYIPGEGVGAVILKRLSDAKRDGDHIYGVIRGSALNHGGKTNGYTVPNPRAQASAIGRALAEAHIDARHVSYIEAHGTGTKLGDPIEIAALSKTFQQHTQDNGFCLIGSAKSNIGHCESAAGIAGLTKVLLQMQHQQIVPSLHSALLNPHIEFDKTPFIVNQTLRRWGQPVIDGRTLPRIAGISSFGAGGANAHMIVEEYAAPVQQPIAVDNVIVPLSARTPEQLKQKAIDLLNFLRPRVSELDLPSVAWTLQAGREAMDERLGFVVSSIEQLIAKLQAYVLGEEHAADMYVGQVRRNKEALAVFTSDPDMQQMVDKWIAQQKLAKLVDLWVKGLELDWGKLLGEVKPQRVSLPAYPFARERYWIEVAATKPVVTVATKDVIHPLLHSNESNLSEQRYRSTFTGTESFLTEQKTIPATAYLEMARAAVEHASKEAAAWGLRDIVLAQPLVVEGETEVAISLWTKRAGEVEFEIYSCDAVLCQGSAIAGAQDDVVVEPVIVEVAPAVVVPEPEPIAPAASLERKEIVLAEAIAAPVERKKRAPIALSAPAAVSSTTASAGRPRVTLANATTPARLSVAPASSPVHLYDRGNGIFSLEIVASRAENMTERVLQALERAEQDATIKVLLLSGIEHCVADGDAYNDAIERGLFRRLVTFPYPVVGVLQGDVIGAGLVGAALCDFLVCNEDAHYAGFAAAATLLRERFGVDSAEAATARTHGWTSPTAPWSEVEAVAERLAVTLAAKSRNALRLLKQHLTRSMVVAVDALTRVEADRRKAVVLEIAAELTDEKALELQRFIFESEAPVVAAVAGDAKGNALYVAQLCDAAVYSKSGVYSAANLGFAFAQSAVAAFTHHFGSDAANEILLAGAEFTGADLQQRVAGLTVADDVVSAARQLAVSPRNASLQNKLRNLPAVIAWDAQAERIAAPGRIALQSNVVSATVHENGIVVVKLEDREAKNMFSDALVAGVREVFAHIEQTDGYKVVVLTGYDNYFSSGGTKESLLAIQEGRTKFTDFGIFHAALECKLPVIAAMQGHGIGAGWSLGMFADIALLSEESRYVSPYMNYGFTPGAGATYSLTEKMGVDLSRESLLTAQQYAGRELKERGLTLRILPRAEVETTAMKLAKQIARSSRNRLIGLKQQLRADARQALNEIYERELEMHEQTFVGQSDTLAQIQAHFAEETPLSSSSPVVAAPPVQTAVAVSSEALPSVTATLKTLLANELQIRESEVDENTQFVDLGLDSITGVTWIRKINAQYKTAIEATKVYAFPTLTQLGRYVKEEAEKLGTLPVSGVAPAPAPVEVKMTPALTVVTPKPIVTNKLISRRNRKTSRVAPAQRTSEPIAIIGMAGQFPQAKNLEEFWQNIAQGKNCITPVPAERWDMSAIYQPGEAVPGKTNCQYAGLLEEHDRFDPLFFNISPTEAEFMDPQQRLFLQACWHSIENAGYDARRLSGSKCGVFVGVAGGDYHLLSREQRLSAQGFMGDATSILAARISYFLNLQGASLSIDTACSSSLVALAHACDSLTWGDSDLALAGGVYVMAGPEMHIKTAQAGMLSVDGRCFTFDQRANGFVPGEGVGVVLLKRLSDAERDGDIIHAVVHGWGVNQDGKTNGITAPNPESQTRLAQEVYEKYRIDPSQIQLIEAHGTGTKLGDPIEVEGLKNAFTKFTDQRDYCALGSVKSNIGHTLTSAGIAGTLKLVLALKNKQLPPTINFERINEHIELKNSPFYVNSQLRDWNAPSRLSAISSFGFSGTNAHVVIGEYVPQPEPARAAVQQIVPLSARTAEQLEQKAKDLLAFLRNGTVDLASIAYTLQTGRVAMDERLGFVVGSTSQLIETLEAFLGGSKNIEGVHRGQVKGNKESLSLLADDDEMRDAILEKLMAQQKLGKLLSLWVKGLDLDWNRLHGDSKPRRVSLPVYPFAKERYWIEATSTVATTVTTAGIHPLLHRNTSDLSELRYTSTFSGNESFLTDHRVRTEDGVQKVLPGVASLEMVRAAIRHAWPMQFESHTLELHDAVWLKPVVVEQQEEISLALYATEDERVDYEIYSVHEGHVTLHCQGQAAFSDKSTQRIDLGQLRRRIDGDSWGASDVYEIFNAMGLHYGPAHQGVTTIQLGNRELLAELRLPANVAATQSAYVLHPSLLDSALQASIGLFVDPERIPSNPAVPFALDSVRVIAPCTTEMLAWVRFAGDMKFDIDLCDTEGNVCVQLRGFALRAAGRDAKPAQSAPKLPIKNSSFDGDFYERLITDVASGRLSVDDAVEIG